MTTARARERLAALTDAEDESQSLALSLTRRIGDLQRSLSNSPDGENAADWRSELIRLQDRLREHQSRHQHAAAICASVRSFLQRLPASADITDFKVPRLAKLTKGETFLDAVNGVRVELAKLITERTQIQQAGLPLEEMQAQAAKWVIESGMRAAPRIRAGHDGFDVSFSSDSLGRANPTVTEILCWLMPEQMKERLARECESIMPQRGLVFTPRDRAKRLADIAAKINEAERMEVELIFAAANEHQHIPHRPAVSPEALLGIIINAKKKVAA